MKVQHKKKFRSKSPSRYQLFDAVMSKVKKLDN